MTTNGTANITVTCDAEIGQGLRQLVQISGQNSKDHGFHDDWPARRNWDHLHPSEQEALRLSITQKLDLIHEEVSEALGEIRSGRDPLEVYFSQTTKRKDDDGKPLSEITYFHETQEYREDGTPIYKPEGFLVELADAIIRIADLAFLLNGADVLAEAQRTKHEYNATRPYKHGRKF